MRTWSWGLVVIVIIAAVASPHASGDVSLRVTPAVAFAPATLTITAILPSNADNRALRLVADSDAFYRSAVIPLDGDRAPRTTTVEFRNVPAGEYQVSAAIIGRDGRDRAVVRAVVQIIGPGAS